MIDVITFDGVSFADFNTFWDGAELFSTPEKDVTFYTIPGRNGDLSISNNRYNNIERNVNCFIREDFRQNYISLINFLLSREGYKRFESTKEPDVYQMAQFIKNIEPQTGAFLKYGSFTLTFNFKPQKWLKSGEIAIPITTSLSITNPSNQIALPLIEVTGTGAITINSSTLTLANNTSTTVIDCETQDCYEGTINRNSDLTIVGGFPVLNKTNTISYTGFTSVKLTPRWWRL